MSPLELSPIACPPCNHGQYIGLKNEHTLSRPHVNHSTALVECCADTFCFGIPNGTRNPLASQTIESVNHHHVPTIARTPSFYSNGCLGISLFHEMERLRCIPWSTPYLQFIKRSETWILDCQLAKRELRRCSLLAVLRIDPSRLTSRGKQHQRGNKHYFHMFGAHK